LSRTESLTGPPVPRLGTTGPTIFVRTKKSAIGRMRTGHTPHVAVRKLIMNLTNKEIIELMGCVYNRIEDLVVTPNFTGAYYEDSDESELESLDNLMSKLYDFTEIN
tara:strand:+ start:401 stop:721 length:321 start_codon:yes stop_codon:yes gene_type:complete